MDSSLVDHFVLRFITGVIASGTSVRIDRDTLLALGHFAARVEEADSAFCEMLAVEMAALADNPRFNAGVVKDDAIVEAMKDTMKAVERRLVPDRSEAADMVEPTIDIDDMVEPTIEANNDGGVQ